MNREPLRHALKCRVSSQIYLLTKLTLLILVASLTIAVAKVSSAQERTVSGRVTDQQGAPLPGVTVQVKDTQVATTTDEEGKYRIDLPQNQGVLVFSNVGFTNEERKVSDNGVIDVTMHLSVSGLDEVVVTALGIERQTRSLTYS